MPSKYEQMSQAALFEILRDLQAEPRAKTEAARAERLLQELQVHQIELEMQNRELREAQQLLEASRTRYADLFDLAPVGYCTFTEDGGIKDVNLSAAAIMGVKRRHINHASFDAMLVPAERQRFRAHLRECFGQARTITTELTVRLTEQGPLVVQMVSAPVFGLNGEVVASRTTLTDISALKHSERVQRFLLDANEELTSSLAYEETLATVVRLTVPLLADVCLLDLLEADGNVRRLEVAFADATRSALADEIKRAPLDLSAESRQVQVLRSGAPLLVADRSVASLAIAELKEAGPARSVMFIPLRIRDSTLGVLTLAMTDSNRVYTSKELALALDVARRAAVAIDNARAYRAAQRATKARDEVLAVVAHDLKSPLAAITLGASSLLRTPAAERPGGRNQLESIRRAARRMARLIGDLVDLTSLEAGHLAISPREQGVDELLADAFAQLQPLAQTKGIDFRLETAEPGLRIVCDRERLLQVLSNLVDNAIKFTPPGESVVLNAATQGGDHVRLSVSDTGPGIAPDSLARVFDRYWQAQQNAHKGSGLGLYIAKAMVEAQGGAISVESQPDTATTFHIVLPRTMAPAPDLSAGALEAVSRPTSGPPPSAATILIVDDDPDIRDALGDVLEDKGYRVAQAANGREAVDYLKAADSRPGLILLDLQMPVMDGSQVMKMLQRDPALASIPVVLVSSQPNLRHQADLLGAAGYLEKPLQVDPLLESVECHRA